MKHKHLKDHECATQLLKEGYLHSIPQGFEYEFFKGVKVTNYSSKTILALVFCDD